MKRILALFLSLAVALPLAACQSGEDAAQGENVTSGKTQEKPATFIADRHIKGRVFIDDAGAALPDDQINNAVAQKVKEMTGITLEWQYTTGDDLEVLITSLASGDIGELCAFYLDNSGTPFFNVLNKASREGMFADLVPMLKECKVYSHYLDPEYMPIDSYYNIMQREEFGGKGYLVQFQIPRTPESVRRDGIGLYINEDMAKQVGVDPAAITSTEELYAAAQKIQDAGFLDANGNAVVPIGPTVWEGRREPHLYQSYDYSSGRASYFNVYEGKVTHLSGTPLMLQQVQVLRGGIAEGLVDPEVLTMSSARCQEGFLNKHYAMMVMSNWQAVDKHQKTGVKWVPVTNMKNWQGDPSIFIQKKAPWCGWGISSKTQRPEEIVRFADFLASKEGKRVWQYGIEGETYTLDDKGMPVLKKELFELMDEDFQAACQLNLGALDGWWAKPLGWTDLAQYEDFGEYNFGDKLYPDKEALASELYAYGSPQIAYYDGVPAGSYINDVPQELQTNLKQFLEQEYFEEVFAQAVFAESDAEAGKVVSDYRGLLEKQGILEFEDYLQGIYESQPDMIHFH